MQSFGGWAVRVTGLAMVALAITACGDIAAPTSSATSAKGTPAATGGAKSPGSVSASMDPCPGGGTCDGGGGGGSTNTNIQLVWFEDRSGGATDNYYEFRQTLYNSSGTAIGYNPQRWHGNSWSSGEVSVVNTGLYMPCYNGRLNVALWQGTWGATVWNSVGSVNISSAENNVYKSFYNVATNDYAIIRYHWDACV